MKIISTERHNQNAKVTGIFFITATVAAIIGLKLYDPILIESDYLMTGVKNPNRIVLGAIFESILAVSAVGTAIMMYPYLKKINESWGLGYVCFRLLEVVFILVGIVSMMSIVTLSQGFQNAAESEISSFQTTVKLLTTIKDWTFVFGPHFMLGINTFIYSTIFFKSKLIPRKLSILGITGSILIFIGAILEMFGIISQFAGEIIALAFPIALYEMILAVWLIRKGFNLKGYESAH
ncbi:hypothetical protein BH23BAC2_BH23BAC2_00210 [soil metagenome]